MQNKINLKKISEYFIKKIYSILLLSLILFNTNLFSKEITNEDVLSYFQDPIYHDLWFGIYDPNGIKYGWGKMHGYLENNQWVMEQSGEYKYLESVEESGETIEGEMVIIYTTKEYYDAQPPFNLKKVDVSYIVNNDSMSIYGTVNNNLLKVETNNNGATNTFEIPNFIISIPEIIQAELLIRKYDNWNIGDEIYYKSFDIDSFEISDEKDVIEDISSKFIDGIKIDYYLVKSLKSTTRYEFKTLFTFDGIPLEFHDALDVMILEDKEYAQSISFGGLSNKDATIYSNELISNNENLERLLFEIKGNYSGELYSGYRQNIIEKNNKIYLELGYDVGSPELATEKEINKNLLPTSMYPINDSKIQNMAKNIVKDSENDLDKIAALVEFVYDYIEDDYISNPLSVYDILEKKIGDCTEHTLLFTTLARAVDIPTREVHGIINYEENKFGLHSWNEVVIDGYWYPVDPTWFYLVPPITHIKLKELEDLIPTFSFEMLDFQYLQ